MVQILVYKWLEERRQEYGWCLLLKKKLKWSAKMLVRKRRGQRMADFRRQDVSMRETYRGLDKLPNEQYVLEEVKEVLIVENMMKNKE